MYNNIFCKISDIGQKFTLGHYIGWNCLKTEVLKKEKAVLLCRNNWNFILCNNCLLVVQQGCKYVILAPLHLKIHAIVFNGMNRDDSLTCMSYCRQLLQRLQAIRCRWLEICVNAW